ncbi:MAG: creatininase family protein [Actinobacteria bacterium]|nr:creatininase family protein [Actinomycetota bacterium]
MLQPIYLSVPVVLIQDEDSIPAKTTALPPRVPTGCTEQQGRHLPVDFDSCFSEAVTVAAAAELDAHNLPVVALPSLPFGPTPEHLPMMTAVGTARRGGPSRTGCSVARPPFVLSRMHTWRRQPSCRKHLHDMDSGHWKVRGAKRPLGGRIGSWVRTRLPPC